MYKKSLCLLSVFILACCNFFAQDFSSIAEGDTKNSVIKKLGDPFTTIKKDEFEYDIWIDKKDIWIISFYNSKVDAKSEKLDDLLTSFLDLKDTLSIIGNVSEENSSKSDEKEIKIDKNLIDKIEVTILECKVINKDFNPEVGYRLKVKNKSDKEISKLVIVLYFYDKSGNVFFEEKATLLEKNSYSAPEILKPNYSVLIPKSSGLIRTVDGIDIEEWNEGKVSFEIIELK
jgi:hypothetical protein